MTTIHRRKSSREEESSPTTVGYGSVQLDDSSMAEGEGSRDDLPTRNRTVSSPSASALPSSYPSQPISAGPLRMGFNLPQTNGYALSASRLQPAFSTPAHLHLHGGTHSRARSISSGPFTPSAPSPLSMTFPSQDIPSSNSETELLPTPNSPELSRSSRKHVNARTESHSQLSLNGSEPPTSPSAPTHSRRHSRLHSRNLSVFFPPPGSLPHSTIAEDGAQELEVGPYPDVPSLAGVPMPSASPAVSRPTQRFGEGFTFGGRPPPSDQGSAPIDKQSPLHRASRRGHHHKHSLSHNFFSFLQPGSTGFGDLTPQATPTQVSPWTPASPVLHSADPSTNAFLPAPSEASSPVSPSTVSSTSPFSHLHDDALPVGAILASVGQFTLGAWLWITGQGVGSLGCTGLGYWVVFDAIGVAVNTILPVYLQRPVLKGPIRRPFGCVACI
jgi:hypothetical protein